MYAEFTKEQFNRETIEIENRGFIVFNNYDDGSCYIHILYVKPQFRSSGIGKKLEQMVINKYKPHTLYSYVDMKSINPEVSLQAIIGAGYKIEQTTEQSIVLKKELEQ